MVKKISDINAEIAEIAETNKIPEQQSIDAEGNVVGTGVNLENILGKTSRKKAAKYVWGGKMLTKEKFLNALVVDVDFCIDYHLDTKDTRIKKVIKVCKDLTIPSKNINVYSKREENNCGIWWGNRSKVGKAFYSKQFLKYYAKAVELKHNSTAFYETYLKAELNGELVDLDGNRYPQNKFFDDDRLLRVETTIKNNQHFKTYGYNVKTLNDLLKLELNRAFLQVFNRPMSKYMTGYREISHKEGMTLSQKFKYYAMLKHAELVKCNIEEAIPYYVSEFHPDIKNHSAAATVTDS